MKRKIFKNKRLGVFVLMVLIFSIVTATSFESLDINSSVNETVAQIIKSIEKITDIEVWANTLIKIGMKEDIIRALLVMDNETPLSAQEIDFYLNESLIESKSTNSEGYAEISFSPYNLSSGNYSFKASFQGNSSLYLNPSDIEKQIEVINSNGLRQIRITEALMGGNGTEIINESLLSIKTNKRTYLINDTINIFGEILINGEKVNTKGVLEIEFNGSKIFAADIEVINGVYNYSLVADFEHAGEYLAIVSVGNLSNQISFYFDDLQEALDENMICKEFEDYVLWTSGYSQKSKGSEKYQTWHPKHNCTEFNVSNCFLENMDVKTRFLYFGDDNEQGEGYIQISEPDESICNNPEKGNYLQYLAYETLRGENKSFDQYCGKNKKTKEKEKCNTGISNYKNYTGCYGIKAYGSQYMLVDVLEIRYDLCWEKGGANGN
ncbi:MAG: hypothetical protein ABH840_03120 [Nanoarchaeota archaeon]